MNNYKIVDNDYKQMITRVKALFNESNHILHKARNEIRQIDYNNKKYVIKSFKIPSFINRIIYGFFKSSKAKRSYENSLKLLDFVPKPIGYVEFHSVGLLKDSYFINEYFDYDFDIRYALTTDKICNKQRFFEQFAKFTFDLHNKGVYHKDYSPGNILIKKHKENFIFNIQYEFKIIDINRMEFKTLSLDDRLKNFSQLWAKDEDLKLIIKNYAKLINEDEEKCINIALKYSQSHKNNKNIKKKLKGKEVVD